MALAGSGDASGTIAELKKALGDAGLPVERAASLTTLSLPEA